MSPRKLTVPVEVEVTQIIADWGAAPEVDAIATTYRVVARAPFDGYVSDAVFTPDAIGAVGSDGWVVRLINALDDGSGEWAITDDLESGESLPLTTILFDQNSTLVVPTNHPRKDWVVVEEGDLIALLIYLHPDHEEDDPRPARPTGTMTVWFTRDGGT